MRTLEQIKLIKKYQSEAKQIVNALDNAKVSSLLDFYNNSKDKIQKNTGPKVLYVQEGQGIIDDILSLLRLEFGEFKVRSAHFFDVTTPHVLHIDDDFNYPNCYKAFTIPLWVDNGNCNKIKLVMFDQYYYGGPVKLFKDEVFEKEVIYYNKPLYDYSEVENLVNATIPSAIKNRLLSHIKDKWLEGLSIHSCFPWTIGSIIAFDSLRIHCSSNFKKVNINQKIGLSIFTEI